MIVLATVGMMHLIPLASCSKPDQTQKEAPTKTSASILVDPPEGHFRSDLELPPLLVKSQYYQVEDEVLLRSSAKWTIPVKRTSDSAWLFLSVESKSGEPLELSLFKEPSKWEGIREQVDLLRGEGVIKTERKWQSVEPGDYVLTIMPSRIGKSGTRPVRVRVSILVTSDIDSQLWVERALALIKEKHSTSKPKADGEGGE